MEGGRKIRLDHEEHGLGGIPPMPMGHRIPSYGRWLPGTTFRRGSCRRNQISRLWRNDDGLLSVSPGYGLSFMRQVRDFTGNMYDSTGKFCLRFVIVRIES